MVMFGVRRTEPEVAPDEYHFNPPQAEIPRLYSSCDIFLCPSWDEGFGLPSAEAMACGCALVTYDNGGSRDFAFHERTALVAPHRDTAALTAQLERLVTDAALRRQLAEAGRRFIAEELPSWETQTARLERLLAEG
jgi:glycosyltransferase involved in cell wall biosynthesis